MSDTKIPVHNAVEDVQGALRGEPIQPGDEGYETARKVYNAMSDKRPAVIPAASMPPGSSPPPTAKCSLTSRSP